MKYATFRYDYSGNLGDEIQSLAASQYLPRIDKKFDRDSLASITEEEEYLVIMNGWFSHFPDRCFPPSDSIVPVFIGLHITNWNDTAEHFLSSECIEYFKRHEPIGCRDKETMQLLASNGIEAFCSKCLTTTFPKREIEPKDGKVFLVDLAGIPLPEFLHEQAIRVSHDAADRDGDKLNTLRAEQLLARYRDEARLVLTTRLHCALPCIAMGVPVVYFGNPSDHRVSVLDDLGIPIHQMPRKWLRKCYRAQERRFLGKVIRKLVVWLLYRKVDWNPPAVYIEKEKHELRTITRDLINLKTVEARTGNRV